MTPSLATVTAATAAARHILPVHGIPCENSALYEQVVRAITTSGAPPQRFFTDDGQMIITQGLRSGRHPIEVVSLYSDHF